MQLIEFDSLFCKSIEGCEKIFFDKTGIYHTIKENNSKIGVVGFIPSKKQKDAGFVQILLKQEYRGKGFLQKSEDLLAKTYNLATLYATIDKSNIASIRAHLKADFKELKKEDIESLITMKLLKNSETRLIKHYF